MHVTIVVEFTINYATTIVVLMTTSYATRQILIMLQGNILLHQSKI
jgi:hypothetical protein